jgi:predicted RNA polymerase sigma factor
MQDRKHEELAREFEVQQELSETDLAENIDEESVGDDMLRLVFTACHPVLPIDARAALTLRLLGGLTTPEIARAYLVSEATIAQRIVRAKRTLAEAQVPFEVPRGAERAARLASVLEVIYLIFNEGYVATSGERWIRPELCEEALRLGRVLAGLSPEEPEVLALVALMEFQASRLRARVNGAGEPVLLKDQNRARWDQLLIARGRAALSQARALSSTLGPYALQAAIAECHAAALKHEDTDWPEIARLYGELLAVMPSPVVALNQAVAVGMASGPAAGLALVESLTAEPALAEYHLLHAVRGDLLSRLDRSDEAASAFERAAELTDNVRERGLLLERVRQCRGK